MIFIDWVTIKQTHLKAHAPLHQDAWLKVDNDGNVIKGTLIPIKYEGSASTSINVKSDGRTVTLSGNIGRLNRPDNVYGYNLDDLKILLNKLMAHLNLPEFTLVNKYYKEGKIKHNQLNIQQKSDGAHFTRLDFTINYSTGSAKNATDFIYQASIKNPTRQKLHVYKTGVTFGSINHKGYKSSKIYIKSADLMRLQKARKLPESDYINNLIQQTKDEGIIRFEVQYQSYLRKYDLSFWDITHNEIEKHFKEELAIMQKEVQQLDVSQLKKAVRLTYFEYQHGLDMRKELPKATYYKHRKELLKYGIDIGQPLNITQFPQQYKTIVLTESEPPAGYFLPNINKLCESIK